MSDATQQEKAPIEGLTSSIPDAGDFVKQTEEERQLYVRLQGKLPENQQEAHALYEKLQGEKAPSMDSELGKMFETASVLRDEIGKIKQPSLGERAFDVLMGAVAPCAALTLASINLSSGNTQGAIVCGVLSVAPIAGMFVKFLGEERIKENARKIAKSTGVESAVFGEDKTTYQGLVDELGRNVNTSGNK